MIIFYIWLYNFLPIFGYDNKFNENILRTSILKKKQAETGKSALMEQTKDSSYEKDSKDEDLVKKVSNEAKEVLSKVEEVVEEQDGEEWTYPISLLIANE